MAETKNNDTVLSVKVIPKASKSEIVGWENENLKIRLKAVPEKGAANKELISFLAKFLHIAKSNISIKRGSQSRHKHLLIKNMSTEEINTAFPRKKR